MTLRDQYDALRGPIKNCAVAIISALGLLSASTQPSQAFFWLADPEVRAQIEHFCECQEWLFSDPDRHQKECAPFTGEFTTSSISTLSSAGLPPAPAAPPPPPPPSDDDDEEEDLPDDGCEGCESGPA